MGVQLSQQAFCLAVAAGSAAAAGAITATGTHLNTLLLFYL
jgi:hypothetical protein